MPNSEEFVPVYLFLGFLEGGKTKFIQESLGDKEFNVGDKILLILCEEGIEEYDLEGLKNRDVILHVIEDESELDAEKLDALQKEHGADCVIIEYNGMWNLQPLFENLPEDWAVYQTILLADATTFVQYNANMRGLVVDKLNGADLVIFNRFEDGTHDVNEFHQIVRGVSRRTEIYYEFTNGKTMYDDIKDPLPFDITKSEFTVADRDFALFYRDIMEEPDKYKGKIVTFKGLAAKNIGFPRNTFAVGRHIMTCCVDDIQYCWLAAQYAQDFTPRKQHWIMVTAKIQLQKNKLRKTNVPMLQVLRLSDAMPPEQEVATFF